jgi:hypothetical protein
MLGVVQLAVDTSQFPTPGSAHALSAARTVPASDAMLKPEAKPSRRHQAGKNKGRSGVEGEDAEEDFMGWR